MKKSWSRRLICSQIFEKMKNKFQMFVEKDISRLDLTNYKERPEIKLNFSMGDPTLSPIFRSVPSNLAITAKCAVQHKTNGNDEVQGQQQCRRHVARKFNASAYEIDEKDVFMVAGGGPALHLIAMLLANPGDNFLFPVPSFPHLNTIAKISSIEPRYYNLDPDRNWEANLEQMASLIDKRTIFIVVIDPSNPLGSCWPNEHKKAILQLCQRRNVPLLADEIYENISCDPSLLTFAELSPSNKVTIFKCSGLAKRYSLPGWRAAWIIVYAEKKRQQFYANHIRKLIHIFPQADSTSQSSIPQIINNPLNDSNLQNKIPLIQNNIKILNGVIKELNGHFRPTSSCGAIYAAISVNILSFSDQIKNVVNFCKLLYAEQNILILPGCLFGGDNQFVRFMIACDHQSMQQACSRLKEFCSKYAS